MKERTKDVLRDGFGCLVNNAAAIRGAKAGPLWLTIVMFVLSIFLPIIPLFVSQLNTNGSTFLRAYSYGLERYVTKVALDLKNTNLAKFSIDENHLLSISDKDHASVDFSEYGSSKPYAEYKNEATGQYNFLVYLSDATEDKLKNAVNKEIGAVAYKLETTTISEETTDIYHPNYMILFKNGVYVVIYAPNSTKAITASYSGDFKKLAKGDDYLDQLLTVTKKTKEGTITIAPNMADDEYVNGVYKNFKKFLDKSYETLKIKNTLVSSAIYLGVFFGLSILMGFLMWILTRGKNNPNNYYTPWLTMKVQARLGLAPALITLIVGFFLTSYAPMIFILTVGLRVMWISMKELRPIQQ